MEIDASAKALNYAERPSDHSLCCRMPRGLPLTPPPYPAGSARFVIVFIIHDAGCMLTSERWLSREARLSGRHAPCELLIQSMWSLTSWSPGQLHSQEGAVNE